MEQRVLVVEDDLATARRLRHSLIQEGFSVEWADNGQRAQALNYSWSPHLFLAKACLPDISGFELCQRLQARGSQPVLILATGDEEVVKAPGLEPGTYDILVKPHRLADIISRLRCLLRRAYGELLITGCQGQFALGDFCFDIEHHRLVRDGEAVDLTSTELRLLLYLVQNPYRPCSRHSLLEAIWGTTSNPLEVRSAADFFAERTVDGHIRRIREKIEFNPAEPQHLLTVHGIGYKFEP